MKYTWDSRAAFDLASVPRAVGGQLKLANQGQLRVLLWLCCVGQGTFDAEACAAACGTSPDICEEAVQFWVQRGMITVQPYATVPPPAPAEPVASTKQSAAPAEEPPAAPTVTLPVMPAASVRPGRQEVLAVRASDEQFAFLLDTAAAKLGKMLSPADMAVYLYIYRDLKLPPEVILLIIGYAVKNGKARLSYIEKTAIHWVEQGLTTFAAADAHLCHLERCQAAWATVCAIGKLEVARPTMAQKETACRWIYEWKLAPEVIETALRYTEEKLGKPQLSYTDKLLERLHAEGVTTAEAANKALEPAVPAPARKKAGRMKTAQGREPSFDLGNYEEMALRHRPRLPEEE